MPTSKDRHDLKAALERNKKIGEQMIANVQNGYGQDWTSCGDNGIYKSRSWLKAFLDACIGNN
jgi:hypothetical protein